jgi:hypothetical protein
MKLLKTIAVSFFIISFLLGCGLCPQTDPQFKMIEHLDDFMIPLGKAVDIAVDSLPQDAKDEQIFSEVVRQSEDPGLLKPFEGYVLKARIEKLDEDTNVGVILLCTPDGKEGIIEDASCTARPDTFRPTRSPCEYLLDVKRVCAAP